MKRSKEELLAMIRERGGESPDEFTISLLEDITDSMEVGENAEELDNLKNANAELAAAKDALEASSAELQIAYDNLKKSYADRFVLRSEEVEGEGKKVEEVKEEEIIKETYDSIF